MSGIEGSYTVLNKFIAGNKPAVVSLPVHNENGFSIYYDKTLHTTADVIHMQNQQNGKTSKLFGFFKLNTRIKLYVKHFKHQTLSMDERYEYSKAWDAGLYKSFSSIDILTLSSGMFYRDVNTWFTWNVNKKEWYARVRKMSTIGYIQIVSPLASDKERYYVSVLLEYVPSPCSHEDLKCGFESFESACINKGLIGTDDEYVNSISNLGFTPANARNFANILISSKTLFHPSLFIDKVFDILTSDLNNIHYRNYGIYLVNNIVLNSNFDNEIVKKRCYLLHIFRSMNLGVDFGSLGFMKMMLVYV